MKIYSLNLISVNGEILNLNKRKKKKNWIGPKQLKLKVAVISFKNCQGQIDQK